LRTSSRLRRRARPCAPSWRLPKVDHWGAQGARHPTVELPGPEYPDRASSATRSTLVRRDRLLRPG
jgi:hypothetical protein